MSFFGSDLFWSIFILFVKFSMLLSVLAVVFFTFYGDPRDPHYEARMKNNE